MASSTSPSTDSNRSLALSLVMVGAGMLMLSYAAVPLYQLFCQVTGFAGTTQRGGSLADVPVLDRSITVSFNADTDKQLPWQFRPLQHKVSTRIGEQTLVAYEAVNESDQPVTGMATYNVTPHEAGIYFHKIDCFCFETQTLKPQARVNMPISFYIDPAIVDDPNLKEIKNITLSYTFFNQSSKNN